MVSTTSSGNRPGRQLARAWAAALDEIFANIIGPVLATPNRTFKMFFNDPWLQSDAYALFAALFPHDQLGPAEEGTLAAAFQDEVSGFCGCNVVISHTDDSEGTCVVEIRFLNTGLDLDGAKTAESNADRELAHTAVRS